MFQTLGIINTQLVIHIKDSPILSAFIIFLNKKEISYRLSRYDEDASTVSIDITSQQDIQKITQYLQNIFLAKPDVKPPATKPRGNT